MYLVVGARAGGSVATVAAGAASTRAGAGVGSGARGRRALSHDGYLLLWKSCCELDSKLVVS
jgi:hypothetical protein